jgi:hypothetical protein
MTTSHSLPITPRLNPADDQERARLQRALYYGLDALIDGHVAPRYEPAGRG